MTKQLLTCLVAPLGGDNPQVTTARTHVFHKAVSALSNKGRVIISPIHLKLAQAPYMFAINQPPEYWFNYTRSMIDICGALIVLNMDGWEHSVGVQKAIEYAKIVDKLIIHVEPEPEWYPEPVALDVVSNTKVVLNAQYDFNNVGDLEREVSEIVEAVNEDPQYSGLLSVVIQEYKPGQ